MTNPWCARCQTWHPEYQHVPRAAETGVWARLLRWLGTELRALAGVEELEEKCLSEFSRLERRINEVNLQRGKDALDSQEMAQQGSFNLTEAVQILQKQIDELNAACNPSKAVIVEENEPLIPGFTRLSQRKRNWEAAHRRPADTAPTQNQSTTPAATSAKKPS